MSRTTASSSTTPRGYPIRVLANGVIVSYVPLPERLFRRVFEVIGHGLNRRVALLQSALMRDVPITG